MKYVLKNKTKLAAVFICDAVGYFFSRLFPHRAAAGCPDAKSFLVVRMDQIGDGLYATAVPKILKEHFPKARLYFLTSSWVAPLLKNNPFIDEVLICDAPWFRKRNYAGRRSGYRFLRLVKALRDRKIDVGIGLRGDFRENLLLALGGMKKRLGYGITGGGFLLTHEVEYRRDVHETQHTLDILRAAGVNVDHLEPRLYFEETEWVVLHSRLAQAEWRDDCPHVGLQIGAGTPAKSWPESHTVKFIEGFLGRFQTVQLVLFGDKGALEFLKNAPVVSGRCVNMVGQTSVRELCVLLKRLDVVVGFDSGPTHVAASQAVPTFFLYSGSNDYRVWRPLSEEVRVFRKPVPCAPCGLVRCNVPGHPCMSEIGPEDVLEALESKMSDLVKGRP